MGGKQKALARKCPCHLLCAFPWLLLMSSSLKDSLQIVIHIVLAFLFLPRLPHLTHPCPFPILLLLFHCVLTHHVLTLRLSICLLLSPCSYPSCPSIYLHSCLKTESSVWLSCVTEYLTKGSTCLTWIGPFVFLRLWCALHRLQKEITGRKE